MQNHSDMNRKPLNFARFYTLFNSLAYEGDREEFRKDLIRQYTGNRTDSLRQMSSQEYDTCCRAMEGLTKRNDQLRKKRSLCLKLMQQLGIDTTDWTRINSFCNDRRIAGKPFARLNAAELEALAAKLRTIQRKGGLNKKQDTQKNETATWFTLDPDALNN